MRGDCLAAGGAVALALLFACTAGSGRASDLLAQADSSSGGVEVSGVRISQGDAVDCPKIRDAAGRVHTVSYLPPGIAIGARVTVRGQYRILTTCLGKVIFVEDVVSGE